MRKLFLGILISIIALGLIITDAEARRFGGGRSFGIQRSTPSYSNFNNNNASRIQPTPAATPTSGASRWLGPLAGLAIGGLLGSLFMSHGLGSGILSWLLIGGIIFLVWGFIRNRMQPATQPMQNNMAYQANPLQNLTAAPIAKQSTVAIQNFDEAAFLRQAKALFIRLQAAYDNKNIADIREFTTPEIFAEIQLQMQERGNENNVTEIISIDAKVLDASAEHRAINASVLFTGLIREEVGEEPVAIKEIWHFRKDDFKPNWAVAGIQQQN